MKLYIEVTCFNGVSYQNNCKEKFYKLETSRPTSESSFEELAEPESTPNTGHRIYSGFENGPKMNIEQQCYSM